jgi:23S rRNA (cytosine1962-C5)-methyltransferase
LAGAESVLAVDASETALRQAIRNAELNGFAYTTETTGETLAGCYDADGRIAQDEKSDMGRAIPEDALTGRFMANDTGTKLGFMTADLVELLPQMEKEGLQYDVVILDPPAFAKSRQNVKNAEKGYRKINRAGMRLVKDGGFLATCTCSHFMTRELFEKMVHEAAREAHVRLRQVEARTQAPDHPILWSAVESSYLKFYIFQVVREK